MDGSCVGNGNINEPVKRAWDLEGGWFNMGMKTRGLMETNEEDVPVRKKWMVGTN